MYHSGPLLHPGYSGASAVDFDLEDHGRQIQLVGQRALRNSDRAGQGGDSKLEYRGQRSRKSAAALAAAAAAAAQAAAAAAEGPEITVEAAGNGLGHSSVK